MGRESVRGYAGPIQKPLAPARAGDTTKPELQVRGLEEARRY